ncbi:hypothetical protein FE257_006098 [Aspergillus nanangensis]|uniref:DBF4-type domain-containing protein n=1 Tax=Aspergillus nanangensis TaxID=2582783 RepID=A0AAD4GUX8_ASPNN|nr:hypothetical protein FE257_006098 [Aspergillus nanangensis]
MATRRPLANVPNATNSPHRPGLVPAKRPRTNTQLFDIPYGQPPPKKQIVDGPEAEARSPTRSRSSAHQSAESKLFARRSHHGQPSAFEKKLVAARDHEKQRQPRPTRHEKPSAETIDSIRQWQRHYRKAFPQFVFYFDSIPEDLRSKCSRQVRELGAHEEKFFSRTVTHIVTSRPIPPENDSTTSPTEFNAETVDQTTVDGSLQTVNPSLLEKHADTHSHMSLKNDARRDQTSMDVLHRARQMGMKIWAIEKLQRMIATINDGEIGGHGGHPTRHAVGGGYSRARGEKDLSQVLQNELHGPSDRNPLSVLKDLVMFKGPFVYIHDMDEKTRPVMVREYPKVVRRQDGVWPQFRSAPLGKCPFIDEPPSKKEVDRHRDRQEKERKALPKPAPLKESQKTKLSTVEPPAHQESTLEARKDTSPIDKPEEAEPSRKDPEPETQQAVKPLSPRKSSESFIPPPPVNRNGPFYTGREPAASGVQPSNITSAIRSQMVSSTAAAPGAKAGVSKEVHELKRKVLEKGNGGFSNGPGLSSYRVPDASTALRMAKSQGNRPGKLNPLDKLGHVFGEDTTQSEGNDALKRRPSDHRATTIPAKKKERRRDPKPGYCENCRDKFDDFEEHVLTRKHRKFAMNQTNWAELDSLLFQIQRPLKDEYDYV